MGWLVAGSVAGLLAAGVVFYHHLLEKLALYRLAVLTGELPNTLVDTVGQCSKPPQLTQPIPVGDGAALLRRRPDIRQAERQMAAASAQIGVATADLYPSINLGLSCMVREFCAEELRQKKVFEVNLAEPIPARSIGMVSLKGVSLPPAASKFLELLQSLE